MSSKSKPKKKKKYQIKRAYYVRYKDEEYGVAYIAHSAREARNMAMKHDLFEEAQYDIDQFLAMRVKWQRKVTDCSDLDFGEMDAIIALKRGAYSNIYETCPICKIRDSICVYTQEIFGCESCVEKEIEQKQKVLQAEMGKENEKL